VWVRAIWQGRIVRPVCHWDTLSGRVLCDWVSHVLASGHTSWHGLNKPSVSHWDVLWRCDRSTAVHWPTIVGGGAMCAAIGTHGVLAGEREPAGEVVGAVVSSTRGKLEGIAAEVSHCKAVCERSLSGSVKLIGMGSAGSSLCGCGE
jgi:hypothetical protein